MVAPSEAFKSEKLKTFIIVLNCKLWLDEEAAYQSNIFVWMQLDREAACHGKNLTWKQLHKKAVFPF
jgi:hypothetical protein